MLEFPLIICNHVNVANPFHPTPQPSPQLQQMEVPEVSSHFSDHYGSPQLLLPGVTEQYLPNGKTPCALEIMELDGTRWVKNP